MHKKDNSLYKHQVIANWNSIQNSLIPFVSLIWSGLKLTIQFWFYCQCVFICFFKFIYRYFFVYQYFIFFSFLNYIYSSMSLPWVLEEIEIPDGPGVGICWMAASAKFSSRSNIRNTVKTSPFLQVSSWSLGGHGGSWWTWRWCQIGWSILLKLLKIKHQESCQDSTCPLSLYLEPWRT